jgi:Tfp pilus assembly protein PilO
MSRVSSINLDALKRPVVLASVAALVVVLAGWWFGWMKPETAKLASVNSQIQLKTAQLDALEATLLASQHDAALVAREGSYLKRFALAVPPSADPQVLTTEIFQLASRTVGSTHLDALTDDTTVPPPTGQVLSQVPITITIDGPHNKCMEFLDGLYKLTRLVTVSAVTPSPKATSAVAPVNVLAINSAPYTMNISATAYFSPTLS